MEIMAFLIGAAARLNPSSTETTVVWPNNSLAGEETDRLSQPPAQLTDWPGHWAITKYL